MNFKIIVLFLVVSLLCLGGCSSPPEVEPAPIIPTQTGVQPAEPRDPTTPPEAPPDETALEPTSPPLDPSPYLEGEPIKMFEANDPVTITYLGANDWAIGTDGSGSDHILTRVGHSTTHRRWYDWTPPEPALKEGEVAKRAVLHSLDPRNTWVAYLNMSGSPQNELIIWRYTGDKFKWEWQPSLIIPDGSIGGVRMFFVDENNGWLIVIFDEGGMMKEYFSLYRTTDGGVTWDKLFDPSGDSGLQACPKSGMVFKDSETGWITRSCMGLYPTVFIDATVDGGRTWTQVELPPPDDAPLLFTEAFCGVHSPVLFPPFELIVQVDCVTQFDPVEEHQTYLYVTSDLGETWSILPTPGGRVQFGDRFTAYALGREIYRSENGGLDWTKVKTVNWDGQFVFPFADTAYVVARNEDEIAYLESYDGLGTFEIWDNEIHPLQESGLE